MKSLKHIALFLSCLVIASCTKDIDEKEPSNECSILDIQLTGQLGKATIERVDDNQGTVTLYIFEQADYPWEAVGVEALALSAYATADVSDGDTLDFRNPERKARIIVRSQTGKQVLWTVYLKPTIRSMSARGLSATSRYTWTRISAATVPESGILR